jgi:hypothetical protein
MTIKYVLKKNHLVDDPNRYAASVRISGSAGLEDIADRIVDQGTTVRKADILAVLENAIQVSDTLLQDGFRIQLGGLVDLFPKIKGSFEGPTDIYDPSRHQVDVAAMPGKRLRDSFREQASVVREESVKPVPSLVKFSTLGSTSQGEQAQEPADSAAPLTVTAGTIATINGYRLKFNTAKSDEGIFFVNTMGVPVIKVDNAKIQRNTAGQLIFLTPSLVVGTYWIEVRTRYTTNGELRIGRLDGTISAS